MVRTFAIEPPARKPASAPAGRGVSGCVAGAAHPQPFDQAVRDLNRVSVLAWHRVFHTGLVKVAAHCTLRDPLALSRQILMQRSYVRLLFAPA